MERCEICQKPISTNEYIVKNEAMYDILLTTKELEGYRKLDRKHFVKPKVDVEELAIETFNLESKEEFSTEDIQSINDFKSGYNAKEAEFTREYMARIYSKGLSQSTTFDEAIKEIKPLSLPKSITTDENYNVIRVDWQ